MYLKEHIKVDNKLNNLGEVVAVSSSDEKLSVVASCAFSKRYLKVLISSNESYLLVPHEEVFEEAADS